MNINDVTEILSKHKIPAEQLRSIVADLRQVEEARKEDKEPGDKVKNQLVPIILDNENKLAGIVGLSAIVVQVPENTPVNDILQKLYNSAYTQNRDAKRKKWAFKTIVDIVGYGKRKFFKEENIHVKTGKYIVPVVITDGNIPNG